jgi:hypothetical protein
MLMSREAVRPAMSNNGLPNIIYNFVQKLSHPSSSNEGYVTIIKYGKMDRIPDEDQDDLQKIILWKYAVALTRPVKIPIQFASQLTQPARELIDIGTYTMFPAYMMYIDRPTTPTLSQYDFHELQ